MTKRALEMTERDWRAALAAIDGGRPIAATEDAKPPKPKPALELSREELDRALFEMQRRGKIPEPGAQK